jgi:hypothetical protein
MQMSELECSMLQPVLLPRKRKRKQARPDIYDLLTKLNMKFREPCSWLRLDANALLPCLRETELTDLNKYIWELQWRIKIHKMLASSYITRVFNFGHQSSACVYRAVLKCYAYLTPLMAGVFTAAEICLDGAGNRIFPNWWGVFVGNGQTDWQATWCLEIIFGEGIYRWKKLNSVAFSPQADPYGR